MNSETKNIKDRLQQVIKYSENNRTLGDFYNSSYDFVETIENHPIMDKLIKDKVKEYGNYHKHIVDLKKNGEIDNDTFNNLFALHLTPHFWHNCYGAIKNQHDVVKVDKCGMEGKDAHNIDTHSLFFHKCADVDYTKSLSKERLENEFYLLRSAYRDIEKLINSNPEYINAVQEEENVNNNSIKYQFDELNEKGLLLIKNKKVEFTKNRALIIKYYFNMKDISPDYLTYIDFCKAKNIEIDSIKFRQSIEKINERVKKEVGYISQIIGIQSKNKDKDINQYRWEIKR